METRPKIVYLTVCTFGYQPWYQYPKIIIIL